MERAAVMLASVSVPPHADESLRLLGLRVATPSGEARVEIPSDRTAFELEPFLVADLGLGEQRTVRAYHRGADGHAADLLDVALGRSLRSAANPDGVDAFTLEVEPEGDGGPVLSFTVSCVGVGEPEAHRAYPRGVDERGRRLADALHARAEPEWFCDGSSTLSCCEHTRAAPSEQAWVAL
jgi:hypothetical protein